MRILFVMPKHGRKKWVFPHAFAFLSAYLKKHIPEVLIDYVDVDRHGVQSLQTSLKKRTYDIIGLTGLTSHYAYLKETVQNIRREQKDKTKIVVGGAIISSYPQFMIDRIGADYYVIGEGEEAFLDLVQAISLGKDGKDIRNVGFKEDGKVIINESRPLISDLDALPWQDYESFEFDLYSKQTHTVRIFASRGCPFSCNFCYRLYGSTYRVRSIENVIEEMEFVTRVYRVVHVDFVDELFLLNRKRIEEFCREVLKRNLKVTWGCALRVNIADPNLLRLMHRAGCMLISYGIESGNQRMLDNMNKGTTVEQNIKALRETRQAGIFPAANCIIGYPGETKETIRDTEKMLKAAGCHAGLHFVQALPGSRLYTQMREAGFIRGEEEYFCSLAEHIDDLPIDFAGLSKEFIEHEQKRITNNLHKYYMNNYRMMRREQLKFHLMKGDIDYFKHGVLRLAARLCRPIC